MTADLTCVNNAEITKICKEKFTLVSKETVFPKEYKITSSEIWVPENSHDLSLKLIHNTLEHYQMNNHLSSC